MLASRFPVIVDTLVSVLTAANLPGVTVFDGPAPSAGDDLLMVIVGHDGTLGETLSGRVSGQYVGIGGQSRDEDIDVECCIIARSGDQQLQAVRLAATALEAQVEAILRASPTLSTAGVFWHEITTYEVYQSNDRGAMCRLPFTVHARCRI